MVFLKNTVRSAVLKDFLFWVAGCGIYAAAVTVLLEPNEITPGGFTGIASVLYAVTKVPTGTWLMLLNVPLLILQYLKLGGGFVVKTTVATFILSLMLNLSHTLLRGVHVDLVLASVFGGVASGLGLSLVLLHGATTGGVDVIAKLINNKFRYLSVGRIIMAFDFFTVALSAVVYKNAQSALYSLITIYASSKIIDSVLYGADKGKIIYIVTSKADKIAEKIFAVIKRGVTRIPAFGAYTGQKKDVLICTVRIHEASAVHKIVSDTDSKAFMFVSDAGEIIGEGFKN